MTAPPDLDAASSWQVTAPGKIILAGEYAVLAGAEAVVAAVDRRVTAELLPLSDPGLARSQRSQFMRAVRAGLCRHAGADSPAAFAAARVGVTSEALRDEAGAKLGLGSSAAVTVAACASALAHARSLRGEPLLAPRAEIHKLAHKAHGDAQRRRGARGSGADVAASVHGGVIGVRTHADAEVPVLVRPLAPDFRIHGVHLVFLWTGVSASTPALVAGVMAFHGREPAACERALVAISTAAEALTTALRPSGGADDVVAAVAAAGAAVGALGRAAGVAIETDAHRVINDLASAHGGAAKPTGAGGGDIALAAFADGDAAAAFQRQVSARGLRPLALNVDPRGVDVSARPAPG